MGRDEVGSSRRDDRSRRAVETSETDGAPSLPFSGSVAPSVFDCGCTALGKEIRFMRNRRFHQFTFGLVFTLPLSCCMGQVATNTARPAYADIHVLEEY